MAVSAYAIVTLAELKDFIGIASTDTTLDSSLEKYIDTTSLEIEKELGRKVVVQSVTNEILNGNGSDIIYPKYGPIYQLSTATTPTDQNKLDAVQYRLTVDGSWTDIEDDVDHILVDADWDYIKLYEQTFPSGDLNIRLNYKAGYSPVPGELWRVALEMAAYLYYNSAKGGARFGIQSKSDSGGNSTFSTTYRDMRKEWNIVLDRYRKPLIQSELMR